MNKSYIRVGDQAIVTHSNGEETHTKYNDNLKERLIIEDEIEEISNRREKDFSMLYDKQLERKIKNRDVLIGTIASLGAAICVPAAVGYMFYKGDSNSPQILGYFSSLSEYLEAILPVTIPTSLSVSLISLMTKPRKKEMKGLTDRINYANILLKQLEKRKSTLDRSNQITKETPENKTINIDSRRQRRIDIDRLNLRYLLATNRHKVLKLFKEDKLGTHTIEKGRNISLEAIDEFTSYLDKRYPKLSPRKTLKKLR